MKNNVGVSTVAFDMMYNLLIFQNSWTALIMASKGGYTDVISSLLRFSPNINAVDKVGKWWCGFYMRHLIYKY